MQGPQDLSSQQKRMFADQVRRLKSVFASGGCLFPAQCGGSAIRSHTVSKSRYLDSIAEGHQVLQWRVNHWSGDESQLIGLQPIYTREASTFPGFCSVHDSQLFNCLDTSDFQASHEQLFMQAFRSHSRELHCKKAQVLAFPNPQDIAALHGEAEPDKARHSLVGELNLIASQVGERDTIMHHARLEAELVCQDYRRLVSWIIPVTHPAGPFIASTGSFFPDFDCTGQSIQDFSNTAICLNTLHFSVLPNPTRSYVILSYLDNEAPGPLQLINSLINSPRLGDLLVWMAFVYIENTMLRPSWWRALPFEVQDALKRAFCTSIDWTSPMQPLLSKCPDNFCSGFKAEQPFKI